MIHLQGCDPCLSRNQIACIALKKVNRIINITSEDEGDMPQIFNCVDVLLQTLDILHSFWKCF